MKASFALFTSFLLIACTPDPGRPVDIVLPTASVPESILQSREPDSCGVAEVQGLIGQPEGNIRTVRISHRYRVVPFAGIVTQEYDAARLNFYLNESSVITRVSCG
ncbi:MAG: hypothetical protein ACJASV_000733 [Pseudorhodobacter sp.]|jgi:hypothetical protein